MQAIAHLASHREAVEAAGGDCHLSFTAVELYQEKLRDLVSPTAGPLSQLLNALYP